MLTMLLVQVKAYAVEIALGLLAAGAGAIWRAAKRAALAKVATLKAEADAAEAREREKSSALNRLSAMAWRAGLTLVTIIQEDPEAAAKISEAEARLTADLAAAGTHALQVLQSADPAELRNLILGSAHQVLEERARAAIAGGQDAAAVTGALSGALNRLRGLAG
ncbi:hypothetical protein VQH23_21160 [Pararoseomonas sp. SCSIO 73927]|uniref:hypothetical protein n=1 Tax=Pararoseomonas sp. SCSIO 73927 TaxID=3114537 RepID=UPI0030D36DB8